MTNEQKFVAALDAIGLKLIKDTDTIYSFENHGYLISNWERELYTTNVDGVWTLVPTNDAEELIKTLEQHREEWTRAMSEKAVDFSNDILPLDLDLAYQLQQKTLQPVIWAMKPYTDGTLLSLEMDVSVTRNSEVQTVSAKIDYTFWAMAKDIPVCESYEELSEFCDKMLDTDEKKQAFVDLNVKEPTGNLENDYITAKETVHDEHYHDGIVRSMEQWWDAFTQDQANILADRLIDSAWKEGFAVTRGDLIELGINNICFGGEYVTEEEPKEPAKNKARVDVER